MSIITRNGVSVQSATAIPTELDQYQPYEAEGAANSIDFVGAILRRKFLVMLFALIGLGGGYLFFNAEQPIFTSTTRLMIWEQAPPSVINGELLSQRVSIEKHKSLVVSDTVLSNAVKIGELDKPGELKGPPVFPGQLKKSVKAIALDDGKSDSIQLSVEGMIAEDLPIILTFIVQSYMNIIGEDSQEAGRESVELIEKLQQKLQEDQTSDQTRYETLIAKLNLTTENERGSWSNPFTLEIARLKESRDRLSKELRDTETRIVQARSAIEVRNDRPDLVKLLAIDARKYLEIQSLLGEDGRARSEEALTLQRTVEKVARLRDEIAVIEADRTEILKVVGQNHPSVTTLDSSLQVKKSLLERAENELAEVKGQLAAQPDPKMVNTEATDREMLQLYSAALVRDRDVKKMELEQTLKDLEAVELSSAGVTAEIVELNILKSKIEERRTVLSGLLDKLSAINLLTNNFTTTKVRVIDPPGIGFQTYPKILNFLAIGCFLGAAVGAGLALLIDRADMSFRTPLQIQEMLRVPVICQIPEIEKVKLPAGYKGSPCLITYLKPMCNSAESFRSGRAAIMYTAAQIKGRVFLFTSPTPGDGKSTTSANIALSFAQLGKKVILIDADFRRPRVAQYLGENQKPGFVDHLSGTPLEECIRTSTVHNNLMFMTTGGHPKNPGEIVIGDELYGVIQKLRTQFDYVIIDSPPLNPVADSSALASLVDGVYMIIRIRRGGMVAASRARDQLDLVNGRLLGVIVNGLDNNKHYYDHGYYGYNYQRGYGKYYESSSKDLIDV